MSEREQKKIYVASSWRNIYQPTVVDCLRRLGAYDVYDFRNPAPGNYGFHWSEIDPDWKNWSAAEFRDRLNAPLACEGFSSDWTALQAADACVLVLPSGRSAHLEAGCMLGARKPLIIYQTERLEPELMYKAASAIVVNFREMVEALNKILFCEGN